MLNIENIKQTLSDIDNKDYVNYQSLLGSYDFSLFKLIIHQIPKDPFAPPHTGIYRIQVQRSDKRIVNYQTSSKIQTIAFADYLARAFSVACEKFYKGIRGTGYSGLISINKPGQAILERNNIIVSDDLIEVRCFLGMPGDRRIIKSDIAEQMFLQELPEIVEAALLKEKVDYDALTKHIETAEDADFIRKNLDSLGLIAFIANNSILPRESGISDKPLLDKNVTSFVAPDNLSYEIKLPNKGLIKGLGIKKGVTLIVGGGFHGKSTLLQTIENGIYNHTPNDGREFCVSNNKSVKVRSYSGRRVINTDISTFINNLPYESDTTSFSTENASGSTSQAANIVEAIEVGAEVLLMDEDTCATNFMIRDSKMLQLISKDDEPITPFIDKVEQLYSEKNISTVLVLGGVGDYFDVSDHIIQMINYLPIDVTEIAHKISLTDKKNRYNKINGSFINIHDRIPKKNSFDPINKHGKYSIFATDNYHINFGDEFIDLTDIEQLMELSQTKALGFAIEYAKAHMDKNTTLRNVVEKVEKDINLNGLDVISDKMSGHFAIFRKFELAFALNRLRSIDVIQK